jgi:acid stress-induced BolA-like protein IbaG/YrbA
VSLEDVVQKIQKALPGAEVYARDLTGGANHFEATVVSALFAGKSRLQRQQLVMTPLAQAFEAGLHAFTFKTYTPDEWEKAQENI